MGNTWKTFDPFKNDRYLFVQDRATYTCDEDYTIVGVATVTCQASGRWSGEIRAHVSTYSASQNFTSEVGVKLIMT